MFDWFVGWESLWHLGWVVLGGVLAFAVWRYHRRNRANDPVTEEATREFREHPERYDETRAELEKKLKPN